MATLTKITKFEPKQKRNQSRIGMKYKTSKSRISEIETKFELKFNEISKQNTKLIEIILMLLKKGENVNLEEMHKLGIQLDDEKPVKEDEISSVEIQVLKGRLDILEMKMDEISRNLNEISVKLGISLSKTSSPVAILAVPNALPADSSIVNNKNIEREESVGVVGGEREERETELLDKMRKRKNHYTIDKIDKMEVLSLPVHSGVAKELVDVVKKSIGGKKEEKGEKTSLVPVGDEKQIVDTRAAFGIIDGIKARQYPGGYTMTQKDRGCLLQLVKHTGNIEEVEAILKVAFLDLGPDKFRPGLALYYINKYRGIAFYMLKPESQEIAKLYYERIGKKQNLTPLQAAREWYHAARLARGGYTSQMVDQILLAWGKTNNSFWKRRFNSLELLDEMRKDLGREIEDVCKDWKEIERHREEVADMKQKEEETANAPKMTADDFAKLNERLRGKV